MNTQHRPNPPEKPSAFTTDEQRYAAIMTHDRAADGHFIFSVKTTGIYCRPSCASRPARRENVRFHATAAAAERAGFRPCKRCQPNGPALEEIHAAKVATACRTIETEDEAPSLDALAVAAGMSRFHFHRVFTRIIGLTPKAYARAHRAKRMREHLSKTATVTEAIYEAGYQSNGRFYAESAQMLGMAARRYRAGGASEIIRFAIGECSLGCILVASSTIGVCAITIGDDHDALVRDLQRRFSRAQLISGDHAYDRIVAQVVRFVEAPKLGLNLPLDVRGTAFQQRVWQALRDVPLGVTASYTDIAKSIGAPKAVRAVAGACAANAIAVAIPCHRIVCSDGSLSGYRWGVERKRKLLDKESAR